MTVANRSPAPTVQNLPDNRSSMSLISRSAPPPPPPPCSVDSGLKDLLITVPVHGIISA